MAHPHRVTTATPVEAPLNLAAIAATPLRRHPWQYAVITETFVSADATGALVDSFPTAGFKQLAQDHPDKNFRLEARNDVQLRALPDPCPWQALLHQLHGPAYRTAVAQLTGVDLDQAILRTAFYRYGPACWFSPHRDDERKLVSHIVYFNAHWPAEAGGHLLINRTNDMEDIHERVVPLAGTSVVVVRGDSSWHSVQPVSPQHGYVRRSLIAHFYQPGSDVSFYDR